MHLPYSVILVQRMSSSQGQDFPVHDDVEDTAIGESLASPVDAAADVELCPCQRHYEDSGNSKRALPVLDECWHKGQKR